MNIAGADSRHCKRRFARAIRADRGGQIDGCVAKRFRRQRMKLSIIIANHNYRDFVGPAIESALAVDWLDKEVIVVDDASTDDSRSIIEGFRDQTLVYFRPKSHQLGAHIFGFEQSTGDIIIFLDADDLLEPEVMREVAKVWRPGVSKVQYRMSVIDATGAPLGSAMPRFPPKNDPKKLRRAFLRTMAYTTPPGSGNAYSRDLVRSVFALRPVTPQSDGVLLAIAPILGDVLTVRKPLARYRIHARNAMAQASLDTAKLQIRLREDVVKAQLFVTVARQLGLTVPHDPLQYSLHHLEYRIASYLIQPSAHPFAEDRKWSLVYRLISAAVKCSQVPVRYRAILPAWAIACALAPRHYRRSLVEWRFAATSRPAVIGKFLHLVDAFRAKRLADRI
jgi:glycosyltransferase involved in cell wall biosynthesis